MSTAVDPAEFVRIVKPALERRDPVALLNLLKSNWTKEQLVGLLVGRDCDARKVAALSLTMVGCQACLQPLADQLKDPDPIVNQMAEHAIWSIWFRCGCEEANHHLCRGATAIDRGDYEHAIKHFDQAISLNPKFAEAYNQRALAEYLLERYDASINDCRQAVELMPIHFGAWAGLGHCYAQLERFPEAVECYEKALSINPHMCQIREAVDELKSRISADA